MSCYHPFLGRPAYRNGVNEEGKYKYDLVGWYDPCIAEPRDIRIPCGKCIGCRLDYSRQWADRMMLELEHSKKAVFVTLTYNNDHVPIISDDYDIVLGLSLWKPHLQEFMKRLRSRKEFENREIRFYASGEYGSNTRRPHYHVIIFGIGLSDFPDLKQRGYNELGQYYYESKYLADVWQNGFILVTDISWNTFAYVSRYVMKKAYADDIQFFQQPEFSLMSRRPGIGAYYFLEHPDCIEKKNIYLRSNEGSVKVGIPKYFMNKVKEKDLDLYNRIMDQKKEIAQDKILLKMQQTDLSYIEQLELEENRLLDKVDILHKIRK